MAKDCPQISQIDHVEALFVKPPVLIPSHDAKKVTAGKVPATTRQDAKIKTWTLVEAIRMMYPVMLIKRQSIRNGPFTLSRSEMVFKEIKVTNAQAYGITEKS